MPQILAAIAGSFIFWLYEDDGKKCRKWYVVGAEGWKYTGLVPAYFALPLEILR
jgi:hypothetical protein